MKSAFVLLLALVSGHAAQLRDVRTVYVFPMRNGWDQYLASELTRAHVVQVTADPKKADAVFTDRIGAAFEAMLDERVLAAKPRENGIRQSTLGGKGALFLVNRDKQVVWSAMETPKDSSRKQLERAARIAVGKLGTDLGLKGKTVAVN